MRSCLGWATFEKFGPLVNIAAADRCSGESVGRLSPSDKGVNMEIDNN